MVFVDYSSGPSPIDFYTDPAAILNRWLSVALTLLVGWIPIRHRDCQLHLSNVDLQMIRSCFDEESSTTDPVPISRELPISTTFRFDGMPQARGIIKPPCFVMVTFQ